MSIAKTLIQKEIGRRKRGILAVEADNIVMKKLQNKPDDPENPIDYSGIIDTNKRSINFANEDLKELETDLKKL